jgi:hypothetical protein
VAAAVNVMPLISVSAEIDTSVVFESPNVAVSAGPLGNPFGVQFAAVFQSPDMGSKSHCALIAYVAVGKRNNKKQRIAARTSLFISNLRFLLSMREITKLTAPTNCRA